MKVVRLKWVQLYKRDHRVVQQKVLKTPQNSVQDVKKKKAIVKSLNQVRKHSIYPPSSPPMSKYYNQT